MTNQHLGPEQEVDELIQRFKAHELVFARKAFETYKAEMVKVAQEARVEKPERKLSPFLYQLR